MNPFEDEKRLPTRGISRENDVGRRTRFHAHTLSARIFVAGEKVLLVRGEPDPLKLFECFIPEYLQEPATIDRLDPAQLGFRNSDIIPLSRAGLISRANSLRKWRQSVEEQLRGKAGGDRDRLRNEWQVIESLGHRVAELHRIFDDPQSVGSLFWLEPAHEAALADWIDRKLAGVHVNPEFRQLSRIVCWMKGIEPLERFMTSFRDGFVSEAVWVQHRHLSHFVDIVSKIVERRQNYEKEIDERNARRAEELKSVFAEREIFVRLRQAARGLAATRAFGKRKFLPPDDAQIDFQKLLDKCRNMAAGGIETSSIANPQIIRIDVREAIRNFEDVVIEALELIDDVKNRLGPVERKDRTRFLSVIREKGLIEELRHYYEDFPPSIKGPNRIHLPSRDSEIDFEKLRECAQDIFAEAGRNIPSDRHIRSVAVLAISGGLPIPLSWPAIRREFSYYEDCRDFWDLRERPGYATLLEYVDKFERIFALESTLNFLTSGGPFEDLRWFAENDIHYLGNNLRGSAAKPFRSIVEWLKKYGSPLEEDDIHSFWNSLSSESAETVAASIARFLGWLSRASSQQAAEVRSLILALKHPSFGQPLVDRLRSWANPPARTRLPPGIPSDLPSSITKPLRRLAFYQRLAGEPARIPGSILRKIEARSRLEAEQRYLASLGQSRSPSQSQRLAYISRRLKETAEIDLETSSPLLNQLREVSVITALSAFKTLIRKEFELWWRNAFDFDPDMSAFRFTDLNDFATWADGLTAEDRAIVTEIMKAHKKHGTRYRQFLNSNAEWLRKSASMIDLEAWSSPEPVKILLDDQNEILVRVATHPIDVFLMGSRFSTCLSIDGGINSRSVIANAADANKAVLYAYRNDGTPYARKLVCITRFWKLIGYRTYAHQNQANSECAFERFCGHWAARSGLGLANHGVPESLTGGFWYDDSPRHWSRNAASAYLEVRPDATFPFGLDEDAKTERFQQVLRLTGDARTDAIVEMGTLDPIFYNFATYWLTSFGLSASETLGFDLPFSRPRPLEFISESIIISGLFCELKDPTRFGYVDEPHVSEYWECLANQILLHTPPGFESLNAATDLMMRLPHRNPSPADPCTMECPVSPAFATLPFRRVVRMLIRYGNFFVSSDFEVNHDAWMSWIPILKTSWTCTPDETALAEAFQDQNAIVARIIRQFCLAHPDRRFEKSLRKTIRATSDPEDLEILRQIQDRIDQLGEISADLQRVAIPEIVAIDRRAPHTDRLTAVISISDRGDIDLTTLGSQICNVWTLSQMSELPLSIRLNFAQAMAIDDSEISFIWPLLSWLATLQNEDLERTVLGMLAGKRREIDSARFGTVELPGPFYAYERLVPVLALKHADFEIRRAAECIFRVSVRIDPQAGPWLIRLFGPYFDPDSFDWLKSMIETESGRNSPNASKP